MTSADAARQRRYRERHGGRPLASATRDAAIREIIERHRDEYESLLRELRDAGEGWRELVNR